MSDTSQGPGWWIASDGKWYPPHLAPGAQQPASPAPSEPAPSEPAPAPAEAQPPATEPPAAAPVPTGEPKKKRGPLVLVGLLAVVALIVVAVVALGGGKKSGGGGGGSAGGTVGSGPIPSGPSDEPNKNIHLAPGVVVIDGKGGSVVKSAGSDGHSAVLDGSIKGVAGITAGKVVLLTGITAVKVSSVEKQGNDVKIDGRAATLPEVIQDGSFQWSNQVLDPALGQLVSSPDAPEESGSSSDAVPADLPDQSVPTDTGSSDTGSSDTGTTDTNQSSLRPFSAPLGSGQQAGGAFLRPGALPQVADGNVKGKVGDLAFNVTYDPEGEGYHFLVHLTSDGNFGGSVDADVHLQGLTESGLAKVIAGHVKNFNVDFSKLSGSAELSGELTSIKQVDSFNSPSFLKIPISVTFPVPVAGIPFSVTLTFTVEVHLSMSLDHNSLVGKVHIDYNGDAGFHFSDGSVSLKGNRTQSAPDLLKGLHGVAAGPVGLVFTAQAPKIDFGFRFLQTGAGVYLANGMSSSQWLAGSQSPIPCARLQVAYVLAGGVDAAFLGKEFEIARKAIVDKRWTFYAPKDPRCDGE